MGESRRRRAALAVAAACGLVLVTAVVYLHPALPGRPPARPTAPLFPELATARLQDFEVAAARVAWACLITIPAEAGLVYATSDGGRTWRQLTVPPLNSPASKLGVQLIDSAHGVLQVGGGLYTTADGGRQWRTASLPPGQRFAPAAHFLSPTEGWYQNLASTPGQTQAPTAMWWTSDGGSSWSERWLVDDQHPRSGGVPLNGFKYVLGFRDASTGWLEVGQGGAASTLLMTSDGGRTWSPVDLPLREPAVFIDLRLLPDGSAVLLASTGSGYLALPSHDGGRTWEAERQIPITTTQNGENRASFMDHDHWATAGGSMVRVTSDAGRTWRTVRASLPAGIASLDDLWLTRGGEGWATAEDPAGNRRVLRTTDGGAHWSQSPVPHLSRP